MLAQWNPFIQTSDFQNYNSFTLLQTTNFVVIYYSSHWNSESMAPPCSILRFNNRSRLSLPHALPGTTDCASIYSSCSPNICSYLHGYSQRQIYIPECLLPIPLNLLRTLLLQSNLGKVSLQTFPRGSPSKHKSDQVTNQMPHYWQQTDNMCLLPEIAFS